jgi:hypothetical protein
MSKDTERISHLRFAGSPSSRARKSIYDGLNFEDGSKTEPTRFRKSKDVLVAGKHYDTLFPDQETRAVITADRTHGSGAQQTVTAKGQKRSAEPKKWAV